MDKRLLLEEIIKKLEEDYQLFFNAAKTAHDAATHQENIPDNKYDTLALESSYIAQGQANRAQEIKSSIAQLKQLSIKTFLPEDPIRLSALVEMEEEDGSQRMLFIIPAAGGLMVRCQNRDVRVITPESPLGRALLGSHLGDVIQLTPDSAEAEIIAII